MNLNQLLKTFLFANIFLIANILSAKEYKVTMRSETLKSATLTSEKGIRTLVSGIQEIAANRPEQIVLELQEFLSFEGTGLNQSVVLDKVNILSSDAKIIAGSKESDVEITNPLPIYRGKISDSESVNLCFLTAGIIGNFHIGDKDYDIKPDETVSLNSNYQSHLVQMIKTPECGENWCKTDVSHIPDEVTELMAKSGEAQLKSAQAQLIAKVAVETDYETYEGFGKDSLKTAAWMLSLMANSSQIFEQEVNVKLEVSYLKVWITPNDPYTALGFSLFPEFENYVTNNLTNIERDVAILIIKADNRLSGGLASLDALGDAKTSILISGFAPLTHELGHIFGSPHTHSCYWPAGPNGTLAPIDKCATVEGDCGITEVIQQEGTIMSYCYPQKNTFGPFVQNLIRARAQLKLGKIPSPTHEVRGKAINNGVGLAGVTINFNTMFSGEQYTATTDSAGNYLISLPDNLYSYIASKDNFFITPIVSQSFNKQFGNLYVSEVNVNGINFNALEVKSDLFEPDDSPSQANEIKPDGFVQNRSIHVPWNFDYFKFHAETGKTYTIVVTSYPFTPPSFNLFDTDEINLLASSKWTSASAMTMTWKAEKNGQYFIQVGQGGQISNYHISIHNVFSIVNSGIAGYMSKNTEWGDFDNDGDFDLLISDMWEEQSAFYLYTNENSSFTLKEKKIENPEYGQYLTVKWADLNNDGNLDIVIGNMFNIYAYFNINGNFSEKKSLWEAEETRLQIRAMFPEDYDDDGDIDIIFSSTLLNKMYILKNEKGTFSIEQTGIPFIDGEIALFDFDNDGDKDIVSVSKYYTNEDGKFYDTGPALDQLGMDPDFAFGDFDSDGDPDLAFSGMNGGFLTTKIKRNNNGIYSDATSSLTGLRNASVNWGDFDNDGDLDLITSGQYLFSATNSGLTKLYENNYGIFEEARFSPTLLQIMGTSNWCDIDGDNTLDLFLLGEDWSGYQTCLLKNENGGKNLPPNAPANLKVQPGNVKTILSWSPATDDKTPSAGLTYNLRLGTTPGKADILSPNSNLKSGKRLVVGFGNAGYLLTKTVKSLKSGTYYWSVQAIDNSYVGSEWAPEQSFTINSNNAPIASAGPDQTVNEGVTITLDGSLSSDSDEDHLTYKWTAPAGITLSTLNVQKPTFIAPEVKSDSTYTFILVVNDGFVDSPPVTVKVTVKNVIKVGISDISTTGIRLSPNPTSGIFHLITENWPQNAKVEIFNYDGQLIFQTLITNSSSVIDLSEKPDGIYIVNISSYKKNETVKIVLRK